MTEVDDVVRPFFERLMALRPVDATYLGIHQHDSRLPEGGRADAEAERQLLERLKTDLADVGTGLDAEVARYFAEVSLFELEQLRTGERMAQAGDVLGTGLFLLLARDFAPLEERMESIAARLIL